MNLVFIQQMFSPSIHQDRDIIYIFVFVLFEIKSCYKSINENSFLSIFDKPMSCTNREKKDYAGGYDLLGNNRPDTMLALRLDSNSTKKT